MRETLFNLQRLQGHEASVMTFTKKSYVVFEIKLIVEDYS